MKEKTLTCIACPVGCTLTVRFSADGSISEISGNKCPRGKAYAQEECTDPKRILTAVVHSTDSTYPCVPVKSEKAIPRGLVPGVLEKLYSMHLDLPVQGGNILLEDFPEEGINIICTRTLPPL